MGDVHLLTHCIAFSTLFFLSVHWTHSSVCLFVLEEILIPAATAAAMKSTILTSFLLAATTAIHTALAYSPPLKITSMTTHQPIGSGSTNFYYINFAIQGIPSRRFSSSSSSAYCQISWGDNGWTNPQPYSIHVPTGTWMNCDSTPGSYDGTSAFQFQLFPYFSIGNFTVGVKQDLGRGRRYVLFLFFTYIYMYLIHAMLRMDGWDGMHAMTYWLTNCSFVKFCCLQCHRLQKNQ